MQLVAVQPASAASASPSLEPESAAASAPASVSPESAPVDASVPASTSPPPGDPELLHALASAKASASDSGNEK